MVMGSYDRDFIIHYCKWYGLQYSTVTPTTFTQSIKPAQGKLTLTFKTQDELIRFTKFMSSYRDNKTKPINRAVIGGGRGGNNSSYSIRNLWDGNDIFMQLAWPPAARPKESSGVGVKTFRISPNIMLSELNQQLSKHGAHSPILCGCLPFMSFGGGLVTNSHTAVSHLIDIVEGIEVLQESGEVVYIHKEDSAFKSFFEKPNSKNIILNIDIEVKHNKKKLERKFEFIPYKDLANAIIETDASELNSKGIIFSPYKLNPNTEVKVTTWKWVGFDKVNKGLFAPIKLIIQKFKVRAAINLANYRPKWMNKLFNNALHQSDKHVIREAAELMGPEATITGIISEVGLLFDFKSEDMPWLFQLLQNEFESADKDGKNPVNTAVYLRFPKSGKKTMVALDFACIGLNQPELRPFVTKIINAVYDKGLNPVIHAGKSYGAELTKELENRREPGINAANFSKKKEELQSIVMGNEETAAVSLKQQP